MPMPIDDDNFSIAVAQVEQASLAAVAASTISNDKRVAMSEQRFTKARSSNRSSRSRRLGLIFTSLWLMLLLQLAKETEGYRAIIPIDEANPGKCIYRGDLLQEGVNNGIPPCQRLTCNADGSILIEGCGKLRIDKCNRGERIYPSKPFPECCKLRYKCKQPGEAPFYIERNAAEGA